MSLDLGSSLTGIAPYTFLSFLRLGSHPVNFHRLVCYGVGTRSLVRFPFVRTYYTYRMNEQCILTVLQLVHSLGDATA